MSKYKFFVIHNNQPNRKKVISSELKKNKIPLNDIEYITFPNKDELTYKIKKKVVQKIRSRHNFSFPAVEGRLKDGWISVTYKHYLALEKIVKNKYPLSVIMEDNIGKFNSNIIDTLDTCITQLPNDWDILFDSTNTHSYESMKEEKIFSDKIVYQKKLGYSFNQEGKIIAGGGVKAAQFYLLNFKSAKTLYDNYLPFNHAPDVWMSELFRYLSFKSFWIEPSITVTEKNHISSTNFNKKFTFERIKSKLTNYILGI